MLPRSLSPHDVTRPRCVYIIIARSRKVSIRKNVCRNYQTALKSGKATPQQCCEIYAKFQSDFKTANTDLALARLCDILRWNIIHDTETVPGSWNGCKNVYIDRLFISATINSSSITMHIFKNLYKTLLCCHCFRENFISQIKCFEMPSVFN